MAGRIPREFIDQLLQRLDIVDVINGRVPLQRAGSIYKACCPFHDEKTPSFTVTPSRQTYHCFGCGAHGSAVGFLMDYERMAFPEAVEELARLAGMEIPREFAAQGPDQDLRPLYDIQQRAKDFYTAQLKQHPQRQRAVEYLQQRGLSGEIAAEFGIGYAPPGWDSLLQALTAQGRASPQLLLQAGLISEPEPGKRYDRLRDRITFPIRDARGRVIGFGGRLLPGGGNDNAPKYLNSPETPIFHKGRHLYGIYEMRQALRRPTQLLIVEGYMDVVALAQQGIRYAVATLGTATTTEHVELLFRQTLSLIFCFDGDRAGREAAWKALQTSLPQLSDGREVRFLFLPEGEDPDSLVRKEGREAFEQRLTQAQSLSDYLLQHLAQGIDLGSTDGQARYASLVQPQIEQLPDGFFRQLLRRRMAKLTGATEAELHHSLARRNSTNIGRRNITRPSPPRPAHHKPNTPLRQAVHLLLQEPGLALLEELPQHWSQADVEGIELLRQLFAQIRQQPDIRSGQLIEHWRDSNFFQPLQALSRTPLHLPESGYAAEFLGCMQRLDKLAAQQEFEALTRRSSQQPLTSEEMERLKTLSRRISR
ncbi:MAG: DNA primase [Gammaproteobacteria bacterium]|nr:DNA primase [Gammaproteobacteria bacterium]